MAIVRFDPFREFATLQNRLFGDVYRARRGRTPARGTWVPPVDIFETERHDLVIKAELPDMTREDIEVTVENNTLTLKGTKKLARRREGGAVPAHRAQLRQRSPARSRCRRRSTRRRCSADYKNGVLTVKLPFREEARPRTINVEVAA